jgi:hypothetical protein
MKSGETRCCRSLLLLRVFWELLRYDLMVAVAGFPAIYRTLDRKVAARRDCGALASRICRTIDIVMPFYFKRVLCLQRSVTTARVMQAYGLAAEVVIGYGFAPFVSHAWVEVEGRVVNDSTGYPSKLQVLERIGPAVTSV